MLTTASIFTLCNYYHGSTFYLLKSKALNATGKPIYFSSSEGGKKDPWLWMAEYANSWRTGPDHHDNWESTSTIINHNADLGSYAGMLMITITVLDLFNPSHHEAPVDGMMLISSILVDKVAAMTGHWSTVLVRQTLNI